MSDTIKEQLSAGADDELDSSEYDFLLRRLASEPELRERWARYHMIGEAIRGGSDACVDAGFAARVAAGVAGEQLEVTGTRTRWMKPIAGLAVAASVTALALLSLQPEIVGPVDEPMVVAPVTANPQFSGNARFASGPAVQWEAARPEVQAQLNQFLLNHVDEAVVGEPVEKEVAQEDEGIR